MRAFRIVVHQPGVKILLQAFHALVELYPQRGAEDKEAKLSRLTNLHVDGELNRADYSARKRQPVNEKIALELNAVVESIEGTNGVERLKLKNVLTGDTKELAADGAFIFVGYDPATACAADVVDIDKLGYIITDEEMHTSAEGIFAAGDCRRKLLRQVVTACGDGATAAVAAEHYVNALKGQTY